MRPILIKPRTISIKIRREFNRGFKQMKQTIALMKLPFQLRMANRLNRRQHLLVQFIAVLPFAAFMLFQIKMNVDFTNSVTYEKTIYFWLNGFIGLYWMVNFIRAGIARLHDCNRSGWWMVLVCLLSFSFLFPIILLCAWPGTKTLNKYGDIFSNTNFSDSLLNAALL